MHRNIGAGVTKYIALLVDQLNRRTQFLTRVRANRVIHNFDRGQSGHIVQTVLNRNRFDKIGKFDLARDFGNYRVHVRIPGRQALACNHRIAILTREFRTVRNLVAFLLTAGSRVDHADFTGTRNSDKTLG